MGAGPEDAQPVEIDWDDYFVDVNEWRERYIQHDTRGCNEQYFYLWGLQAAIDWALEHHKTCAKKS